MIEAKWLFQYIYNQQVYPIQRLWKGIYIYESASSRNLSNVKTAEHIRPRMSRSLYENMVPDRKLGDTIFCLMGEEKEAFLDLIKGMLLWHPDMRKKADPLAKHPFFQPEQISASLCERFLTE
ncbi:kinase-like protein [Penicillium cf. griseofulvum]|uniref:Kinase-like protein n=1 Tax=Penicillium cf. griseofulvum TaxID=2972120 RepID=A0A9W9MFX7_9EURO|nr:kinase-like protein [Penicillium cf. griseofulvum]KAJ5442506.1 kinase-like protein [Penicillium cf. griseofulvum]